MKRTLLALSIALLCGEAVASNTDPLDFDYQIDASTAERPALVFNDGTDTYIQPRDGQVISSVNSHREGPYVVVAGVPASIQYSVNGNTITANWEKGNNFTSERGNATGDLPPAFAGFSDRLILVGSHGALDSVQASTSKMQLSQAVKTLVPQRWTGSAAKSIDLTDSVSLTTRDGETWLEALDRLMKQTNLYAQIDFANKHVSLRDTPPKSVGVSYAANALPSRAVAAVAVVTTALDETAAKAPVAAVSKGPSLFSAFGANAIRDKDANYIQLRFAAKPGDLTITSVDGKSLKPKWDDATRILTFNRADRFVVADGRMRVVVARVRNDEFHFDLNNAAGLAGVFDKDGATYLKFAESVVRVDVFDADHMGRGEQKGHYYKFDGVPEKLTVVADGNVVEVTRASVVRFYENATS